MATVRDIYIQLCYDLMEPGGLQLGLVSDSEYLRLFKLTLLDFLNSTGILRRIFTQTIFAGVTQYTVPDDILRVDMAFLQGHWLPRSTAGGIANAIRNWRTRLDIPLCFHEDSLPVKTLELAPGPVYNGTYIPGADEPDPIHGQYDSFSAVVFLEPNPLTPVSQTAPQHRGLTVIGPFYPGDIEVHMDCEIPGIPDDIALSSLLFGILERIYGGDNELRSPQQALYCHAMYQESISLMRAIAGEADEGA